MNYQKYMKISEVEARANMASTLAALAIVCREAKSSYAEDCESADLTRKILQTQEYQMVAQSLNAYLIRPFLKNHSVVKSVLAMDRMRDEEDVFQECLMSVLSKIPTEISRVNGIYNTHKGHVVDNEGYVLYLNRMIANDLIEICRKYNWKYGRKSKATVCRMNEDTPEDSPSPIANKNKSISLEEVICGDKITLEEVLPGDTRSLEEELMNRQLRKVLPGILNRAYFQTKHMLGDKPLNLIMLKVLYYELRAGRKVHFRELAPTGYTVKQQVDAKHKVKKVFYGILRQELYHWH